MNKAIATAGFLAILLTTPFSSVKAAPPAYVVSGLKQAGATQYAEKIPYGKGIAAMYIGYNAEGSPVMGIAERETKTYAKVKTVVSIQKNADKYKITKADVLNDEKLKGKSKELTTEALKNITGREFDSADAPKGMVDAVSGATKYYQAIYISYSLMVSQTIEQMKSNPDWKRIPLP